ncbi:SMI1/KNR4 family protein [Streptomyces albidoflavus]|uniref:SMI1/KNR4 family protein n=1 Tax=unclassified Streptomyces TaxID=2593676 RepID=UPI001D052987|nr:MULTISPECIES: SMI1/KNR4 family protein [unclassified Streptomyces]UDF07500.1 SMI1/KNR4 family protein [Streptomyces sp. WA1-19]UYX93467.1 SMI1/KNR4 family protein [Streptomyces sp. BI87]
MSDHGTTGTAGDEARAEAVRDAWARIDAWMRAHAPDSYEVLAPPADPTAVEAAQAGLGVRFPADLLASLACHDGLRHWANCLPLRPPEPVARIVDHWQMCVEIDEDNRADEDEPEPEGEEPWWHPQWIPWAQSDGDAQIIDMRPGPDQGRLGMAYHDDCGVFADGWPSLAAYLTEVAEVLEKGGAVGGTWVPYLTTEGELWWSLKGETQLNGEPLTPAPAPSAGS